MSLAETGRRAGGKRCCGSLRCASERANLVCTLLVNISVGQPLPE